MLSVDKSEIKCFLGILILSRPEEEYIGKTQEMYIISLFLKQCLRINSNIITHTHFSDHLHLDKSDKFIKLRPPFNHPNKKFLENSSPEDHHNMFLYNRRHGCYEVKLWVGTSRLGYINWFEPGRRRFNLCK